MNLKQRLERPFPVSSIRWRAGATTKDKSKCIPLAYIDARDVMRRLDDAVGFENWQCRYPHAGKIVICEIGILRACVVGMGKTDEWMWRSNGSGETDIEGEKGACSKAMVRAGVAWGIGRYLYALPNVWVPYDGRQPKELPTLPEWATPEGYDKLIAQRESELEKSIKEFMDND